ncbi:MAG: hypothetical protein EXQ88_02960 [Alphaproteobacteria bacterium]|nr:hypothetical protein [Alphaproteobacteria bacterium]
MRKHVLLAIGVLLAALAVGSPALAAPFKTYVSKSQKLGQGSAVMYAAIDDKGAPVALGFSFTKGALDGLPAELNPKSICFDKNGDGRVDVNLECLGDYTLKFELPDADANKALAPFKWAMINWNPHGHASPAPPPWAKPHFDFHFYVADRASVEALRPGKMQRVARLR